MRYSRQVVALLLCWAPLSCGSGASDPPAGTEPSDGSSQDEAPHPPPSEAGVEHRPDDPADSGSPAWSEGGSDGARDAAPVTDIGLEAPPSTRPDQDATPDIGVVPEDQGPSVREQRLLSLTLWGSGTGKVANNAGPATCSGSCSWEEDDGAPITLSASPDAGSVFAGWSYPGCGAAKTCVVDMSAPRSIAARFFHPALLSPVDKSPDVKLTPDRLGMEMFTLSREGVRSETAIAPGSGMFYFEGQKLVDAPWILIGVATSAAPLDTASLGASQGFNIDSGDGSLFDPAATSHYGFIIDYRQTHPIVHLIAVRWDGTGIVYSTTLTQISGPLYIFVGGLRRNVGAQASVNTGNDIVNFPFYYDPIAALQRAGLAGGDQLVLGFGDSYAAPPDQAPSIQVSAAQTIPFGSSVTVTATATDPEEGDLTSRILWGDLATPLDARVSGQAGRFTLTPDAIGLHELLATVVDSAGKSAAMSVRVTVSGTLPVFDPVRLVSDASTGAGVVLTADGLGAHFTGDAKMAIRANQGLYHGFQYFEFHRELDPVNMGGGLVTGDGDLNPYGPRDIPASCSVNVTGSTWKELMFQTDLASGAYDATKQSYYGFAVDYRGESPTIYVIIGGKLVNVIRLPDATVPLYPMLYGYPVTNGPGPDETINFGTKAFQYDPRAVLSGTGVDLTGLQVGWGKNAR